MPDLVTTVVPLALVVGLSPLPMLPVFLLLMTPRGRSNGLAYLGGWLVALTAVVAVALALGSLLDRGMQDEESIGWVAVVSGLAFLALAAATWLRRPRGGATKQPPRWMTALDGYEARQSARLGALLAATNPKVLLMAVAAGAEIAVFAGSAASRALGLLLFVAIGSVGVASPVLLQLTMGSRADDLLATGKAWLQRNDVVLTISVLVVLALLLLAKGLPAVA